MNPSYWHKQTVDQPLFDQLIWSKPENKKQAGKLLIVGGNVHSVTAPALAYQAAVHAGIGSARVILPDAIAKTIGKNFEEGSFAFSTPSGSFAKTAVNRVLEERDWAEAVLLAGDFGRNSETAIFLEQLLEKYKGPLVMAQDSLDYFTQDIDKMIKRPDTLMVASMSRLQKMTRAGMPSIIIRHSMTLHALVGLLNSWTRESGAKILTYHNDNFIYAEAGQVSTTLKAGAENWEVPLSAYASVWRIQHAAKGFEAVTTAIWDYARD
ncbi:MAG TPA: hypothetical protein VFP35_04030 [Candidatus Saccharimonadales bacterium]|nr:hypothetical protein [Candidatus Saccharimonadales bacterium]